MNMLDISYTFLHITESLMDDDLTGYYSDVSSWIVFPFFFNVEKVSQGLIH